MGVVVTVKGRSSGWVAAGSLLQPGASLARFQPWHRPGPLATAVGPPDMNDLTWSYSLMGASHQGMAQIWSWSSRKRFMVSGNNRALESMAINAPDSGWA